MFLKPRWWNKVQGGVQCLLCPHHCIIPEGKRGLCRKRENLKGELSLCDALKVNAIQIDPIEKKPLYHFLPGMEVLSIGTYGCNLSCLHCQNHNLCFETQEGSGRVFEPSTIEPLKREYSFGGIAFTYNEPSIIGEYLIELAKEAKRNHLKTLMVSNGYVSNEALDDIYEHIDGANIDLKSIRPSFYQKVCHGQIEPVLETLSYLAKKPTFHLEITNLLIPGFNDSDEELVELLEWCAENLGREIPIHFSAFFPTYKLTDCHITPSETLERAYHHGKKVGMSYIYIGNSQLSLGENTYCPQCNALLISRKGFQIIENRIKLGSCPSCERKIKGFF